MYVHGPVYVYVRERVCVGVSACLCACVRVCVCAHVCHVHTPLRKFKVFGRYAHARNPKKLHKIRTSEGVGVQEVTRYWVLKHRLLEAWVLHFGPTFWGSAAVLLNYDNFARVMMRQCSSILQLPSHKTFQNMFTYSHLITQLCC